MLASFNLAIGKLVERAEAQFKDPKSGPQKRAFVLSTLEAILKGVNLSGFWLSFVMKLAEFAIEWELGDQKASLGN